MINHRLTSQYYTECLHCGKKAKSGQLATDLNLIVPVKGNADVADAFYELQKAGTVEGVECDSECVHNTQNLFVNTQHYLHALTLCCIMYSVSIMVGIILGFFTVQISSDMPLIQLIY